MSVSSVTSNSLPFLEQPDSFAPVGDSTLDQQDFMELFITQLQYQDPMEPMNSYEMASQLAQFSNMEATMKMADNMEQLLAYQTSQNNLQLLSLIDKDVQAFGNQVAVVDGEASVTEFNLTDAADTCIVEIYDASGRLVKTMDMGYQPSGVHELAWDGTSMQEIKKSGEDAASEEEQATFEQAADGAYFYRVDALNSAGQQVEVDYRTTGHVTGVQFDSGHAVLTIDKHINIDVNDVLKVM